MNRRSFLMHLAGLGASVILPVPLLQANASQLTGAWSRLLEAPYWFEVSNRTIVEPGGVEASLPLRSEVYYAVEGADLRTPDEIIDCVNSCSPLWDRISSLAADRKDEIYDLLDDEDLDPVKRIGLEALVAKLEQDPDGGWQDWVEYEGVAGVQVFRDHISKWLAETADWDEFDYFPRDFSAQGKAMVFFEELEPKVRKALGVVIIEGEHPGSTYYAAELRKDIVAANDEAARLKLPFRFRTA